MLHLHISTPVFSHEAKRFAELDKYGFVAFLVALCGNRSTSDSFLDFVCWPNISAMIPNTNQKKAYEWRYWGSAKPVHTELLFL